MKYIIITPQQYTREQEMLNQLFGQADNQILFSGKGNCLPKVQRVLLRGNGLLKNGDLNRNTARMFGARINL